MEDTNPNGTSQAGGQQANPTQEAGTTSTTTNAQQPGAQDAPAANATQLTAADYDRMSKELKDTRREAASYRTKLKEFEDRKKAKADAELSETERLKKQLEEATTAKGQAETTARQLKLERAVEREAASLKFTDPADALPFIQAKIELDEKGEPTNVKSLLNDLVKSKPYLTEAGRTSNAADNLSTGSVTNPPRQGAQTLTADKVAKMKPEEIVKLVGTPELAAYLASTNSN